MSTRTLISGPVLALVLAGSAAAADLPQRSAPPVFTAAPIFTWTGFYVGVNAGGVFNNRNNSYSPGGRFLVPGAYPLGFPAAGTAQLGGSNGGSRNSFEGGVQAGYNYQVGSLVYGIEADINFLSNRNSNNNRTVALGAPFAAGTLLTTGGGGGGTSYIGTVRGRIGLAYDRFLPYITGGLAYGNGRRNTSITIAPGGVSGVNAFSTFNGGSGSNSSRVGYALGAGLEYAFTNNLSAKIEYLYTDLRGKKNRTLVSLTDPGYTFTSNGGTNRDHHIRVGLNYKF